MRLLELTLSGVDLDEMRQFYVAILGLREVEPAWTNRLSVQVGNTQLSFLPAEPGWHGRYHFAFDVPAHRFETALAWLDQRRARITSLDGQTRFYFEGWNADSAYFTDPQGNILELIARRNKALPESGPAARDPGQPFNASEILSVSEIGIPSEDVTGAVALLQTRIPGLGVYQDQRNDDFTPVGDEDGLLILVRRGRIWFPDSSVPADYLPLNVLLEQEPGVRYRINAPPYPFLVNPA
jgi:catechol 2,3-dioxygenase-like lactoylglutathione lyase family enzyme